MLSVAHPQRHKISQRLGGEGKKASGHRISFWVDKRSKIVLWGSLHNAANVLKTTALYIYNT